MTSIRNIWPYKRWSGVPDGVPHWVGPINFKFSDAPNDGDICSLFNFKRGDMIDDIAFSVTEDLGSNNCGFDIGVGLGTENEYLLENSSFLTGEFGPLAVGSNPLIVSRDPGDILPGEGSGLSIFWVLGKGPPFGPIKQETPLQLRYAANGGPDPLIQGKVSFWILLARGVKLP